MKTIYQKAMSDDNTFTWRNILKDTFKGHTKEERDKTLVRGLSGHIPNPVDALQEWNRPWMYSRVAIFGTVIMLLLMLYFALGGGDMGTMGILIMVPSLAIPFAVMMLFWELNIPGNFSLPSCIYIAVTGGFASFIITILISLILELNEAYMAAIPEEIAKLLLTIWFIKKYEAKGGLNGLVIGASVGMGFAVMETVGYVMSGVVDEVIYTIYYCSDVGMSWAEIFSESAYILNAAISNSGVTIIILRGILSIGGHVVWAALYGGALGYLNNDGKFHYSSLRKPMFLITFITAFLLHTFWNAAAEISTAFAESGLYVVLFNFYGYHIILVVLAWVALLFVTKKSFRQYIAENNIDDKSSSNVNHGIGRTVFTEIKKNHTPSTYAETRSEILSYNIEIYNGENKKTKIMKNGDTIFIGRDPQADVPIVESYGKVSRQHCKLSVNDGLMYIEDLSANGTFYNDGERLPKTKVEIKAGESFYLFYRDIMVTIGRM